MAAIITISIRLGIRPSLKRERIHYPSNNESSGQKSYEYKNTVLDLLARCAFGNDGENNGHKKREHEECRKMRMHLGFSASGDIERIEHNQIIQQAGDDEK